MYALHSYSIYTYIYLLLPIAVEFKVAYMSLSDNEVSECYLRMIYANISSFTKIHVVTGIYMNIIMYIHVYIYSHRYIYTCRYLNVYTIQSLMI